MVDKLIPPIVIDPEIVEEKIGDNPVLAGLSPEADNFYFKVSPPEERLKLKSSVVMQFPLYSSDASETSNISDKAGTPLSFQEIYRNYTPEDFARLMTETGVISKGIRYALLYNYFGFPVANLWTGEDYDPNINDINYVPRFTDELVRKRVPSRDVNYGLSAGGDFFNSYELGFDEFIEEKKAAFVGFAKGFYQLGQLGELPSFLGQQPGNANDVEFKVLGQLKTANISNESPSYDPSREFFNFMHGSLAYGETINSIGNSFSYVEPIGVAAEFSGFKVETFEFTEGFIQSDLRFKGSWDVYTNNIPKTYARAWRPTTKLGTLKAQGGENIDDTVVYTSAGGTPEYGVDFTWKQQITQLGLYDDSIINSLSITLGGTGESNWYIKSNDYLEEENSLKYDFKFRNIASMYGLVPSNKEVPPQYLESYRKDPAKTLNLIYPRIFKYVRDVCPIYMIEEKLPSGQGEISTPLNASDIITPEQLASPGGIKNSSFLRKFRIGWNLQSQNIAINKPNPAWTWDNLGFTHTIGTADKQKGGAFGDIINKSNQSLDLKKFRNKISLNFKTELHKDFALDSIGSTAVKGFFGEYQKGELPDSTKGIFDPTNGYRFLPNLFNANYNGSVNNSSLKDDQLYKNYYLSTKMLSYLFFKIPSGFEYADAKDADRSPVQLDTNLLIEGQRLHQNYPALHTALDLSFTTEDNSTSEGALLDAAKNFINEEAIEFISPDEAQKFEYGGSKWVIGQEGLQQFSSEETIVAPTNKNNNPDFEIKQFSDFALPIWKYDRGTTQDPKEIVWNKLVDTPTKEEALKEVLSENPTLSAIINAGLPDWVSGLRIYPSPDKQIIPTNPKSVPGQEESPVFNTFNGENAEMEDVASAALKLVAEPQFDLNGNNNTTVDRYVEVRYAIELEIDEKKLILDMVGQGIASLDGTIEDYQNAGFSIPELLGKSNGNVSSPELIQAYESGEYDFGAGLGVDLSNFPDLFGSNPDLDCTPLPPDTVVQKVEQILLENPNDQYAVTSYVCLADLGLPTIGFKESPGSKSKNIGYLSDQTTVKVLKEWVNGKGEFNKIKVVDPTSAHNGKEGFIDPKYLRPVSPRKGSTLNIFFEQKFPNLKLKGTEIIAMSDMAKALIPTWYRDLDQPYYHREDGEYWISVTLPFDCIKNEEDLENMKQIAKANGLRNILDFYNKSYNPLDLSTLVDTYLVVRAEDYYLDSRPGSRVKILVKVGAIYVNSFFSKEQSLEELKKQSARILSLDSRYFQLHLEQALYSLNKIYLDIFSSKFTIKGIDFAKEAERLSFVPTAIKKIIAVNGFDISKQTNSVINIGFDENFKITFISYIEDASEISSSQEEVLDIGFDFFVEQEPFSFPNTMSLLYYHRELKNPILKWETVVNEWLPSPKPQIEPKTGPVGLDLPSEKCGLQYFQLPPFSSIMMGVAERLDQQLDLHPRYDLGSFQFNLLQFFPPCPKPPPGKGTAFFKFLSEIDGQTTVAQNGEFLAALQEEAGRIDQYVGDFLSSGAALRDLKTKIFDLDDLYSYVLNYITPETLYSKICKCFIDVIGVEDIGVPNLSISANGGSGGLNLDPSTIANNPTNILNTKGASFDTNFIDEDGNFKKKDAFTEKIAAEDLFCSFCFRIPSIFFRLPTTDILGFLLDALRAILEFALAQILLELIASLLDALLTCPELNCATGETRLKDYGAQSISGLLESYSEQGAADIVTSCGIIVDGQTLTEETIIEMLFTVSKSLTTSEVLGLFDGSAPKVALESVRDILIGYPSIEAQLSDLGKISDFFACMGTKVDPSLFAFLEEQANSKLDNPVLCDNLAQSAKDQLFEKCGNIPGFDEIANKNLNHDLDKYKELAKIIRDNDDLSSQLPSLFSDGQGSQALLSGQNVETAEFALQKSLDTMIISTESDLVKTTKQLTKGDNALVKVNKNLKEIKSLPELVALPVAIFMPPLIENKFAGLKVFDGEETVDQFMFKLSQGLNFGDASKINRLEANLTTSDYVHIKFNEPAISETTGEPIYTNNYEVIISSKEGINATIAGEGLGGLSEELKNYLAKYKLESGEDARPEQAQFFANLLLANFIGSDKTAPGQIEIPDNTQTEVLRELFAGDLYYSILSSMIDQMGIACSKSSLLKKYEIEPFNTIPGIAAIAILSNHPLFVSLALAGGIESLIPEFYELEAENLDLTSIDSKIGPQTFVDFNYGSELAKQAYDFSKFYDPNSEVIGMPHFAMMEGIVSWTMQLFVGETLTKGLFVLPSFPKDLFFNEVMIQFVVEQFSVWLNDQEQEFRFKWYALITRLVYERSDFTPKPNSNKPTLPGEFGQGSAAVIDGMIYDTTLGREMEIKSWRDATAFYVRQNFSRPLEFLKLKLKDAKLKKHTMESEVNPLTFIAHKNLKEVHTRTFENYSGDEPLASSLFLDGSVDEFKNGKFFFQFYYRLVDHEEGDPMYNENLVNRDLNKIAGSPLGFVPPTGDTGLEFPPNPFDIENPFVGFGEAEEDELDIVVEGDPYGPDHNLKGVLNREAIDKLWSYMANSSTNIVDGNYGISAEDQKKPFKEFFKAVKIGVRLCYATVSTTEKDQEGIPVIDIGAPQSEKIKELNTKIATAILQNAIEAPELLTYSSEEKALIITENTNNGAAIQSSYIFPIINQELDITNNAGTPFDIPVASYSTAEFDFGESIFAQLGKYTKEGSGAEFIQKLMSDMFDSVDIQALYTYSIPISKLVSILMVYNALGIQTDQGVNSNFDSTKEILKQSFESIYDIKGTKAYAYEPPYIKKRGGTRGVASKSE
jgi:hypothetical protein